MPRILIVGCGSIGGLIAAYLNRLHLDVHVVSRNPITREAVQKHGFQVKGFGDSFTVNGNIYAVPPDGQFDYIFLTTQPTDVENAMQQVKSKLSVNGQVVVLQNGLCEPRVARVLGDPERVIGAIVAWGATTIQPGVFEKTSKGGFIIGPLSSTNTHDLQWLAESLSSIGKTTRTTNLLGARWSKLALNCVVSSLGTIGGNTLGRIVRQRHARVLALEIISEVVRVAQTSNIKLQKVSGTMDLEWLALTPAEKKRNRFSLFCKHLVLLAVGVRFRRLRSSMLRAIEAGKPPAIDYLNGEVVDSAQRLGIAVPINEVICATIWKISRGEQQSSLELITKTYNDSRT